MRPLLYKSNNISIISRDKHCGLSFRFVVQRQPDNNTIVVRITHIMPMTVPSTTRTNTDIKNNNVILVD